MKKILLASMLCAINMLATAQPVTLSYSRSAIINNNLIGNNNLSSLVGCQEMSEAQMNILSKINMQNQICKYESYSKITEKWITNPPQQYVPPRSVVITLNKQEMSEEEKQRLQQTSQFCQNLANKMRVRLKEMYSVDNLECK